MKRRFGSLVAATVLLGALVSSASAAAPWSAPGPPWPDPVVGQRVYDYAGVFLPETEAATHAAIVRIEQATQAQVAVFAQVKPDATETSTEQDAISLMDTWGVGRRGVDDGLVILWNLDTSRKHGQVQLYAGPGFRQLVSNQRRQAIFEDDMLPLLRTGDLNGAMLVAMDRLQDELGIAHPTMAAPARWTAKLGPSGKNGTATLTVEGTTGNLRLALRSLAASTVYPVKIVKGTCARPGGTIWAGKAPRSSAAGRVAGRLPLPAAKVITLRVAADAGPVTIVVGTGSRMFCGALTGLPALPSITAP